MGAWPLLSQHGYVDRGVVGVAHGGLPEPQLGVQHVDRVRQFQVLIVLGHLPELRLGRAAGPTCDNPGIPCCSDSSWLSYRLPGWYILRPPGPGGGRRSPELVHSELRPRASCLGDLVHNQRRRPRPGGHQLVHSVATGSGRRQPLVHSCSGPRRPTNYVN